MPTNTAPVKWAQRSDSLYVTISLPDVKDETITLTDAKLVFTGKSNDNEYACDFEFFKGCKAETSTYKVLPRSIQMHIMKAEEEEVSRQRGRGVTLSLSPSVLALTLPLN